MLEKEANALLKKYHTAEATAAEKAIVEQWYLDSHALDAEVEKVDLELEQQKSLNVLMNQINPPKSVRFWPLVAVAASIALIFAGGVYFYNSNIRKTGILDSFQGANAKKDISPGVNGATLTLANGRKIYLTGAANTELANEAGVRISKTADGQVIYTATATSSKSILHASSSEEITNTLSTSKGQQYQIVLPDQTKVWLNASSSIKYPASFASTKERRIEMVGEAYFEVSKLMSAKGKKRIPFIVSTRNQTIEVLGTHFNVNSYTNEPAIRTTLLEGSVKVRAVNRTSFRDNGQILSPGQQSLLTQSGLIKMRTADTEQELAWKNGQFYFKDAPLKTVMQQISRWYNVEVIYNEEVEDQVILGGWISRSKKLSAVLNLIELTGQAHFKVEGRRITVMP